MKNKKYVCVFLNGDPPNIKVIKKVLSQSDFIICADGAANYLKKINIIPNIITGDLDSITPHTIKFYKDKARIIKISEQNSTDFEKCLRSCKKLGFTQIFVLGFSSTHTDHTLGNYSILKKYYKIMSITFVDDLYFIAFIVKKISFTYKKFETISLLAITQATGIKTHGLKYPLKNERLVFGSRDGTRNMAISKKITISFSSGNLLLFKKHFLN